MSPGYGKYVGQLHAGRVVRLSSLPEEFSFLKWASEMTDDLFMVVNNGSAKPRAVMHLKTGTILEGPVAQGCQFIELANELHHGHGAFASVGELVATLLTCAHEMAVHCGEDEVLCVEKREGSLHFCSDPSWGALGYDR